MWWCQPRGEFGFGFGFVVVSLLVVDLVVCFLGWLFKVLAFECVCVCVSARARACEERSERE